MRPISATIDLNALRHNLNVARTQIGPQVKLHAVVKADAYGHGLARVRPALDVADGLAVIELEKALELRTELAWIKEIVVLEGFYAFEEIALFQAHSVSAVVHTVEQIEMLERVRGGKQIKIFLKLNSGMNRLGFPLAQLASVYARLHSCQCVGEIVVATHFARADEPEGERGQWAAFQLAMRALPGVQISVANSAATMKFANIGGHYARPGIMLYGSSPLEGTTAASLDLKPVMHLNTQVIAIQNIASGEAVGYGGAFVATRASYIAVLAGGYADGYPRSAKQGTPVWVAGVRVPLVGRVSMDKITVDATNAPHVRVGSPSQLWGAHVSVDEVATHAGTISYELLTGLAARVRVNVLQ
jgi:alanine racemase